MLSISVATRLHAAVGPKSTLTCAYSSPRKRPATPGGTPAGAPMQYKGWTVVDTVVCSPDLLCRDKATVLPSAGVIGGG